MHRVGVARGMDEGRRQGRDRPGCAYHDQQPCGQRGGGPQPSDPARGTLIGAESLHGSAVGVPDPDPGGFEVSGCRAQRREQAGRVPDPPAGPDDRPDRRRRRRDDLRADPVKPVSGRLDRVGRQPQRAPQRLLEHGLAGVRAAVAHASRSSTERSADIAREVWLLTAPLVMPIAAAICVSERSP